jgi:2-polyprenyl-6-methoxyphenol hydroxylase-like FAD-dependent oxidoreductase
MPEAQVPALLEVSVEQFEQALNDATGGAAGTLRLRSERMAWPLGVGRADKMVGPGWALLGDAAHVVHPLSGQGLNLGLADVAALVGVIAQREQWRRLGDERLLRRYERERLAPTWAMRQVTDGLLHLFASEQAPLKELRNRGLTLVNHLPPLKRWLVARALDARQ